MNAKEYKFRSPLDNKSILLNFVIGVIYKEEESNQIIDFKQRSYLNERSKKGIARNRILIDY